MNEVSIHGSYIYLAENKIKDRKKWEKTEELGSKRGQIEGPTKDQRSKTYSW